MAVWNEIAASQPLSQPWFTLFRLTPQELPGSLDRLVDKPLEEAGADNRTVLAYRLVAPLLIESEAISAYIEEFQKYSLRAVLPEILSVSEAVALASLEYRLTPEQERKLTELLDAELRV